MDARGRTTRGHPGWTAPRARALEARISPHARSMCACPNGVPRTRCVSRTWFAVCNEILRRPRPSRPSGRSNVDPWYGPEERRRMRLVGEVSEPGRWRGSDRVRTAGEAFAAAVATAAVISGSPGDQGLAEERVRTRPDGAELAVKCRVSLRIVAKRWVNSPTGRRASILLTTLPTSSIDRDRISTMLFDIYCCIQCRMHYTQTVLSLKRATCPRMSPSRANGRMPVLAHCGGSSAVTNGV